MTTRLQEVTAPSRETVLNKTDFTLQSSHGRNKQETRVCLRALQELAGAFLRPLDGAGLAVSARFQSLC